MENRKRLPFQLFIIRLLFPLFMILFVVVITFITTSRDKTEHSVILSYEIDTERLSKKEIEDVATKYLIPTLQGYGSKRQMELTWQSGNMSIQVFAHGNTKALEQLKRQDKLARLELPAYLKVMELFQRQESAKKLRKLRQMLDKHAAGNNEKYPIILDELKPYDDESLLPWLHENIEYLGKGKARSDPPDIAIAYDKTLLEKSIGTNILFNDGHDEFVRPDKLEKMSIVPTSRKR